MVRTYCRIREKYGQHLMVFMSIVTGMNRSQKVNTSHIPVMDGLRLQITPVLVPNILGRPRTIGVSVQAGPDLLPFRPLNASQVIFICPTDQYRLSRLAFWHPVTMGHTLEYVPAKLHVFGNYRIRGSRSLSFTSTTVRRRLPRTDLPQY
jgi:hypothetical protein